MDGTLTDTITPGQSRPGSNGDEKYSPFPNLYNWVLPSDAV